MKTNIKDGILLLEGETDEEKRLIEMLAGGAEITFIGDRVMLEPVILGRDLEGYPYKNKYV